MVDFVSTVPAILRLTQLREWGGRSVRYLRLALKAQSQRRATLETLATIKNPPVIYAKQANITSGPQQVNTGTLPAPVGGENAIAQYKLLEQQHGQWVAEKNPLSPEDRALIDQQLLEM